MLDLGCGTSRLAISMHRSFEEIVAVDPITGMIKKSREIAKKSKVKNIRWIQKRAEDLSEDIGNFRLVTIGIALHWMDAERVLRFCYRHLTNDGGIALIFSRSLWCGTEDWQKKTKEIIKKFLGEERRTTQGKFQAPKADFGRLLAEVFPKTEEKIIPYEWRWDIESVIGYLYTTSFCSRTLLGDKTEEFENTLKKELLAMDSSGRFKEIIPLQVILGWKNK